MVARHSAENGQHLEDGPWQPAPSSSRGLSADDRAVLELAKKEHAQTTESAKRALKVAEATQEVARGTLVEVHRQGQVLDKAEAGFQSIEEDVVEASSLLRFMRRWCCIQVICCCDCFDPDVRRDRMRKKRVQQRRVQLEVAHAGIEAEYAAKQQAVERKVKEEDPAYGGSNERARSELFDSASKIKDDWRRPKATDIGLGLPEEDRRVLQQHSEEQDVYLDRIGSAVGALRIMSQEMNQELGLQDPKIERLQARAEASHDKLGTLSREARRV